MTTEATIWTAEFPRAVRGYATHAVDDYVRQIGERLEAMQQRLDEQTERASRLAKELETANNQLAAFAAKEAAIANALVGCEQRRVTVEQELEAQRENARLEVERILSDARAEAERLLEEAKNTAEGILAEAQRHAEEATAHAQTEIAMQEERIQTLCAEYDRFIRQMRQTLEDQLARLPEPGDSLALPRIVVATTPKEPVLS